MFWMLHPCMCVDSEISWSLMSVVKHVNICSVIWDLFCYCVIASHKLCSECCIRVCVLILKYLEVYWVSWSIWECYLYMQEAVFLTVCICIYFCVSVVAEHSVPHCMWHLLWTCFGGCRLFWTLCAIMYVASPLNLLAGYRKERQEVIFTESQQCACATFMPERHIFQRVRWLCTLIVRDFFSLKWTRISWNLPTV